MNPRLTGILITAVGIVLFITLILIKNGIDYHGTVLCNYYHENNLDLSKCPVHNGTAAWFMTTAFMLDAFLIILGVYAAFHKCEPKALPKQDLSTLDSEEKSVLDLISQSGSAYQSDLIRQTGFSKVKITRILDKLESKGAVERKRRGMTNIIVLR